MNYTDVFYFDSDNLALLEGPVNQLTGAAITNTPAVTSAKCRTFNDAKDSFLTAAVSSGTTLSVSNPSAYEPNIDRVVLWLDSNAWHECGLVTARDVDAGTITITTTVPSAAREGARVCGIIGNLIGESQPWERDMTYFDPLDGSTATAGNFDYGWRVVLPDSLSAHGFDIGVVVRCELVLDVAANVKVTKTLRRLVVGGV